MLYMERADVCIELKDAYLNKKLFEAAGKLSNAKLQPKYYTYCIVENGVEKDLDGVLWDNVGRRIEVSIRNVGNK